MRRILVMLAALLAVPAVAFGAVLAEGDGSLGVTGANGTIVIQGHGVIYGHSTGHAARARLQARRRRLGPVVSIAKASTPTPGATYTGSDVRFLLPSGRYTLELIAANLNASAVGQGSIVATRRRHRRRRLVHGQRRQAASRSRKLPTSDVFGKGP